MKMHAADDQRNSAAQDGICFERARAERGEDSAMTIDCIADRLRIEQVPLNDAQSIAWLECLPVAHKRGDRMAEIERASNQQPANSSSSTKDDDLHETFRGQRPARPLYRALIRSRLDRDDGRYGRTRRPASRVASSHDTNQP